jgi:hypothetical protein
MEAIEMTGGHELFGQAGLHGWRAARLARLGFPGPRAGPVAGHVDGHEVAALVARGGGPRARAEHRLVNTEESCGFR